LNGPKAAAKVEVIDLVLVQEMTNVTNVAKEAILHAIVATKEKFRQEEIEETADRQEETEDHQEEDIRILHRQEETEEETADRQEDQEVQDVRDHPEDRQEETEKTAVLQEEIEKTAARQEETKNPPELHPPKEARLHLQKTSLLPAAIEKVPREKVKFNS